MWHNLFVGEEPNSDSQSHTFVLSPNAMFHYYNYIQYQQALVESNKNSKRAKHAIWIAILALFFNAITLIETILMK